LPLLARRRAALGGRAGIILRAPMTTSRRQLLRRLKLRHVLLVLVLLSSVLPLVISSALLIPKAKDVLQDAERDYLTRKALALSREIDTYLVTVRRQLTLLGSGILLAPGPADLSARLHEGWVPAYLEGFARDNPALQAVRLLDFQGEGPRRGPGQLSPDAEAAMDAAFEEARATHAPSYRFINEGPLDVPNLALAVPVAPPPGQGDAAGGAQVPATAATGVTPTGGLVAEALFESGRCARSSRTRRARTSACSCSTARRTSCGRTPIRRWRTRCAARSWCGSSSSGR
jgi:hypothetical protein